MSSFNPIIFLGMVFTFGGIKILVIYVWRYWIASEIQKYLRSGLNFVHVNLISSAKCNFNTTQPPQRMLGLDNINQTNTGKIPEISKVFV